MQIEKAEYVTAGRWDWEDTRKAPYVWAGIFLLVGLVVCGIVFLGKMVTDDFMNNFHAETNRRARIAQAAGLQQTDAAFTFAWNAETDCEAGWFSSVQKCLQSSFSLIEHSDLNTEQQRKAKNVAEREAGIF